MNTYPIRPERFFHVPPLSHCPLLLLCLFAYAFILFGRGLIVAYNDFKLSLWPMMASLESLILLPPSPKSWDYSYALVSLV